MIRFWFEKNIAELLFSALCLGVFFLLLLIYMLIEHWRNR